jgi:hypothetical protein
MPKMSTCTTWLLLLALHPACAPDCEVAPGEPCPRGCYEVRGELYSADAMCRLPSAPAACASDGNDTTELKCYVHVPTNSIGWVTTTLRGQDDWRACTDPEFAVVSTAPECEGTSAPER